MADIKLQLKPFGIPGFVYAVATAGQCQGVQTVPCWPVKDLDATTLAQLCDDFRAGVFALAKKEDSVPAPQWNVSGMVTALRAYLDTKRITPDTIGDIRRTLFMPWESQWNALVREETAARERNTGLIRET